MKDAFYVSYDSCDAEIVQDVCQYLKEMQMYYWLDTESLSQDDNHQDVLECMVKTGGYLLSFFSKKTCNDPDCRVQKDLRFCLELTTAFNLGYSWFLPVKVEECTFPDIAIHPKMSLRHVRPINSLENGPIGIEILRYCGKHREIDGMLSVSTRNMIMMDLMESGVAMSMIEMSNIQMQEMIRENSQSVEKWLEGQLKMIHKVKDYEKSIKKVVMERKVRPDDPH